MGEHHVAHAAHDFIGALQGRAIGQLRKGHKVLLVLRGHETSGHAVENIPPKVGEAEVEQQRHHAEADGSRDDPLVGAAELVEEVIEGPEEPAKRELDEAREGVRLGVMSFEQQGAQGRGERQRIEGRDDRADGDGEGELLVELPGQAADERSRNEHRAEHQRGGNDGAGHFAHGLACGIEWVQPFLDVSLHVLDDDDGVIHHDPDGEHEAEERQRIDGEAHGMHDGEGADQGHRHRRERNDRSTPGLQEHEHHDDHEQDRFEQGVNHGFDRLVHEHRRVIGDAELDPWRKGFLQLRHLGAHVFGELQRIRSRLLEDGHGNRAFVVQRGAQAVFAGAEFDASNVAQLNGLTIRTRLDDDLGELFLGHETALGGDLQLHRHFLAHRLIADGARRHLCVLRLDGTHDVARRHIQRRDLVRVQPDAHGIVARAEDLHLTHAGDTGDGVLHIHRRVVPHVDVVVATIGREKVDHHREVGRTLHRGHAQPSHFFR